MTITDAHNITLKLAISMIFTQIKKKERERKSLIPFVKR